VPPRPSRRPRQRVAQAWNRWDQWRQASRDRSRFIVVPVCAATTVDDRLAQPEPGGVTLIRRARVEDADALAELAEQSFRTTYSGLVDEATLEAVVSQVCTPDAFARLARCEHPDQLLVAEDSGVLRGFLDFAQEPDGLELRRLYARAGETGRGTGSTLLAALEDALPAGTSYRIVVIEGNTRALAFWQRHGFRLQGEVDGVEHFTRHRGLSFQPGAGSARLLVLHRTVPAPGP
jgi:ribosomal protein S18 acetylase RimI-like enzyme